LRKVTQKNGCFQMPYTVSADTVWLRKWIEVPKTIHGYHPTGAKIWLREPNRGGLTVYCDGVRVARDRGQNHTLRPKRNK
jgi:hypothetical protein